MKVRRAATLAPIALFATACASRPWTPSVSVAYWAEDVPSTRPVGLPGAPELMQRWQLPPDSPWARYSKMTLLASVTAAPAVTPLPDVRRLETVARAEALGDKLGAAGIPDGIMFVVDLRGAAAVAFGAALSRRATDPIAPVLTFNNWPAENGFVPAEETLAALVALTPRATLPGDAKARPVFLLDAWRLAYRNDRPADDVVDNRYALTAADLPDADTLRERGIQRIVYVVESLDDTEVEEDDVHESAAAWFAAGIPFSMVDLDWLESRARSPAWADDLGDAAVVVRPRQTLMQDPAFYARARGGFGVQGGTATFRAHPTGGGTIRGGSWGHGGG